MKHCSILDFLLEGERLCGEWMIMAHGTRYRLSGCPFVVFDIIKDGRNGNHGYRLNYNDFMLRLPGDFTVPKLLYSGQSCSIEQAMKQLGTFGHHGALEETEGAVWRVEQNGKFDFIAKYLRRDSAKNGIYLIDISCYV